MGREQPARPAPLPRGGGRGEARGARVDGGSRTTRYDARVSVERFAEIMAADAGPEFLCGFADGMREQLGADAIETRVWLDEDGLIRREEVDLGMLVEGRRIDARDAAELQRLRRPPRGRAARRR